MDDDQIESFPPSPTASESEPTPAPTATSVSVAAIPSQPTAPLSISPSPSPSTLSKSKQHRLGVSVSGRAAIAKPTPLAKPKAGWAGEGFGGYMREKERKLREQFDAEAAPSAESKLFDGVTVWVTGATKPPRTEIRRLLAVHGGKFETYLSRDKVTHIIADNLATATRRRLASSPGKPSAYTIVTAAWIPDSIAAGKLLPAARYTVRGMSDPEQRRVTSLFTRSTRGGSAAHNSR